MQQILQNESEGAADRFQRWVAPLHLLAVDDVNDITLNPEEIEGEAKEPFSLLKSAGRS